MNEEVKTVYKTKKDQVKEIFGENKFYTSETISILTGIPERTVATYISDIIYKDVAEVYDNHEGNITAEAIHQILGLPIPKINRVLKKLKDEIVDKDTLIIEAVEAFLKYNGTISMQDLANLTNNPKTSVRRLINHKKIDELCGKGTYSIIRQYIDTNADQRRYAAGYSAKTVTQGIETIKEHVGRALIGSTRKYSKEINDQICLAISAAKIIILNIDNQQVTDQLYEDVAKMKKIDQETLKYLIFEILKEYEPNLYNTLMINLEENPNLGGR